MEFYSSIKNDFIYSKMDGTVYHHVKKNKPDSEGKLSHVFSHALRLTEERTG